MSDEIVIQKRLYSATYSMKVKATNIYRVRIKLSWKVKVMIKNVHSVYTRAIIVSQIPPKM